MDIWTFLRWLSAQNLIKTVVQPHRRVLIVPCQPCGQRYLLSSRKVLPCSYPCSSMERWAGMTIFHFSRQVMLLSCNLFVFHKKKANAHFLTERFCFNKTETGIPALISKNLREIYVKTMNTLSKGVHNGKWKLPLQFTKMFWCYWNVSFDFYKVWLKLTSKK